MESRKISNPKTIQLKEAENIPNLPNEIIGEILGYLPVKPLSRLRCVSKSWRTLISSPDFVKSHLKKSLSNENISRYWIIFYLINNNALQRTSLRTVLYEPAGISVDINSITFDQEKSVHLVGSCNGLVCILIGGHNFLLWNPATRKFKHLPNVVDDEMIDGYGFGFDKSTDDYKVFAAIVISADKVLAEMYSSKSNSWKIISPVSGYFSKHGSSISTSGKLYWGPTRTNDSWRNIEFFDLENEVFGEVKHPHQDSKGCFYFMTLCVFDGCFCVYYYFPDRCPDKHHGEAWVLKGHGVEECWEKVFSVFYDGYPLRNLGPTRFFFAANGEVLLCHGLDLVVYSLLDRSFRLPAMHGSTADREVLYVCNESLVSLDGEQEMQE